MNTLSTTQGGPTLSVDGKWWDKALLDAHLLEKALCELGDELNNRPDRVHISLQSIRHLPKEAP